MVDQSHLDTRYFVDSTIYNCPFCNRRHVSYYIVDFGTFDWTESKKCMFFVARCESCRKRSMHLTFKDVARHHVGNFNNVSHYRFTDVEGIDMGEYLDSAFFFSVPTSFFVLDDRVPSRLRELLTEAEGCVKSNFLTGASACARKIVYELGVLSSASGENYEDRIKSLKELHPEVDSAYFDTLLTIQQLTSSKVHENSYDGWESKHLRVILAALREVLHEIYVVPALRADRRKEILSLRDMLNPVKDGGTHG